MPNRVVWVPSEAVAGQLGAPPEVTVRVWDGSTPRPAADAQFLVPPFLGSGTAGAFDGLPDLEVVQLMTAGAEAYLPLVPPGVLLCTARGAHTPTTAEWTVAALLAAQRDLPDFLDAQRAARWAPHRTGTLFGARVLIVGYGDIGAAVADRLVPFGAEIVRVARTARPGVEPVERLPELLPAADVVVLLTPLTEQTRGMVDTAFLARMKHGALLVNAARGALVDTDALVRALGEGRIRAALDVTDPEPLPAGHPLWTAPGLLLTPHVAGSTTISTARAVEVVRAQLSRWLTGAPLENQVTPRGY